MFVVHARNAWLKGLSPKENREVPPLRYDWAYRLKRERPHLQVVVNGGIADAAEAGAHLAHTDGAMLGREAYHRPVLLAELSAGRVPSVDRMALLERMTAYARREMARGERLSWITRHMLGLYSGLPGAKEFRRQLSEGARDPNAPPDLLLAAGEACERLSDAAA
jgi:tRNA-dihydrouridine synthase A